MKKLKFSWIALYAFIWVLAIVWFWALEGKIDALGYSLFIQCLPLGVILPFVICLTKARKGLHWSLAVTPSAFCAGLGLHHYFTFQLLNLSSFSTSSRIEPYPTHIFDKDFWSWTLWPTLLGIAIGLLIYVINDIKSKKVLAEK